MFHRTPALVFSFLCLLVGCAQLPQPEVEKRDALSVQIIGERVRITARNGKDAPLEDFVRIAQAVLGKVILFAKADFVGRRVDLSKPLEVPRSEFWKRFQTILYKQQFACVLRGEGDSEVVDVIFAGGRHAMYVPASSLGAQRKQDGIEVITSITLRHITASVAEERLRKNLPEGVRVGTTGRSSAILLQGHGPQVHEAFEILKKLDVPKKD